MNFGAFPAQLERSRDTQANSSLDEGTLKRRMERESFVQDRIDNAVSTLQSETHGPAPRPETLSVSAPSPTVAPFSRSCFLSAVLNSDCCVRTVLGARPLKKKKRNGARCDITKSGDLFNTSYMQAIMVQVQTAAIICRASIEKRTLQCACYTHTYHVCSPQPRVRQRSSCATSKAESRKH